MPLTPRLAGPLLALLLSPVLVGCGGPSGECTGSIGSVPIEGELGGETMLAIAFNEEVGRVAGLVLEYGDGALLIESMLTLPAEKGSTEIPFGPGASPGELGGGGVDRFRFSGPPESSPRLHRGVLTVRQVDSFRLEGNYALEFEDASSLRCTFDVSGKNRNPDDQLPGDALFPTP